MLKCKICNSEIDGKPFKAKACGKTVDKLCCKCAGNLNLFDNKNATKHTTEWAEKLIVSDCVSNGSKMLLTNVLNTAKNNGSIKEEVKKKAETETHSSEICDCVDSENTTKDKKSRVTAALLCFFLGFLGIHRFYVGKLGIGFLWLITGGLFGIGTLVDFIIIICGGFTDSEGLKI